MLHQKEILQWLKMFNFNQIKHFVTIKNPAHQNYIQQILTYQDFKPNQRINHGYSQQKINQVKSIYQRDLFRYKTKKQQKKAVDEMLFQNITVSRTNPYALSVKKSFIRNGKLSQCMLVLSGQQIFNCMTAKYSHSQLGSYQDSAWFQIKNINSLSMWIVRFFQLQIFEAFYAHESIHAINHLSFAEETITSEKGKEMLQNIIASCMQKNRKIGKGQKDQQQRLQISKEEAPYLLSKSLQKLQQVQQDRELCQIVFQEIWVSCDRTSKVFKLYRQLERKIMAQYNEHILDLKCQQIESFSNSKKKKKRAKKTKQETKQQEQVKKQVIHQTVSQQPLVKQQVKIQTVQTIAKINNQFHQKEPSIAKPVKLQKQSPTQACQKFLKWQNKEKQQNRKAKAIVRERINEYILSVYQQLKSSSQNFDKYRKICYQFIKNTMSELKLENEWKLQLFGSASINFALKHSDLDLVLMVQSDKVCTLKDICELFRVKEWLKDCKIIDAKVPIVSFQVLLSQIKHPKSNKKSPNLVIHVDISISYKSTVHQGVKNTSFLKEIFDNHPILMTICLILKELLRVNRLNKPYTGGISSYVLVILVHNILKSKNISFNQSLLEQIKHICRYMASQFQPFVTLITPFKHSKTQASSQLSLNIEDPHERVLLHTSARLINQVMALFKQLHNAVQQIESDMMGVKVQERKKMKRIFFDHWNMLFQQQQQSDLQ